ncbi:hypothetical protein WEI85_18880 [Actinomycetes bacterium KLBMP 9797]
MRRVDAFATLAARYVTPIDPLDGIGTDDLRSACSRAAHRSTAEVCADERCGAAVASARAKSSTRARVMLGDDVDGYPAEAREVLIFG